MKNISLCIVYCVDVLTKTEEVIKAQISALSDLCDPK